MNMKALDEGFLIFLVITVQIVFDLSMITRDMS